MIVQFDELHVIEAIRIDEHQTLENHFSIDCGWSKEDIDSIEHFDFYTVEIKATDKNGNSNSAYLGACCSENFDNDIKTGIGGYLPQLIQEAIEGITND